jgi:phenylalanyl-tRNA synthetase beta chain
MLISYDWLKEYVQIGLSPEKLGEMLTMAGLPVESIKNTAGGYVLELEVTANRPDWLSHIGVAREIAAITGKKLKLPSVRHCEEPKATKQSL